MVNFYESYGSDVDVKEIMEYINMHIFMGDDKDLDIFEILNLEREMRQHLEFLNRSYSLNNAPHIIGSSLAVFIKKIIYRTTRWYFDYIIKQQSDFNANMVRYLNCSFIIINTYKKDSIKLKERLYSSTLKDCGKD